MNDEDNARYVSAVEKRTGPPPAGSDGAADSKDDQAPDDSTAMET